MDEFRGLDNTI